MPKCATRECGAEIVWVRTRPGNKPMPIDKGSAGDPAGNIAVWREGQQHVCRVLKKGEPLGPKEWRYVNHWTTCKKAGDYTAKPGWHHNPRARRWQYADDDGVIQAWISDARLAEVDWPDVLAQLEDRHPEIPPLPDAARPAPQPPATLI